MGYILTLSDARRARSIRLNDVIVGAIVGRAWLNEASRAMSIRSWVRRLGRPLVRTVRKFVRHLRSDRYTRKYNWVGGNYRWIFSHLKNQNVGEINYDSIIVEIGSRDCLDSIELHRAFRPSHIYAFEPSKSGISRCLNVLSEHPDFDDKITLCGFALGETSGMVDFHEFTLVEKHSGHVNIGASSLYPWTSRNHRDDDENKGIEKDAAVERVYKVPAFRADDLNFLFSSPILLMVMDVEGAELSILKGARRLLSNVKYICLEAGYNLARDGDAGDAEAVTGFLAENGWELVACNLTNDACLPVDPGHLTQFDLLFRNPALADASRA